jgi:uncharacterized protein (DUF1499 family)
VPLISLTGNRPSDLGPRNGRLHPCPSRPNCVCSDESGANHGIEALRIAKPAADAWKAAESAVLLLPRTEIVILRADYLHAECRSALLGFIDDLELQLRESEGIIAVRSASRLGYSDLGVNRKRVEALRTALRVAGAIR